MNFSEFLNAIVQRICGDVLEVAHEGTNDVNSARKHELIQEYELFKMQQGESIT